MEPIPPKALMKRSYGSSVPPTIYLTPFTQIDWFSV